MEFKGTKGEWSYIAGDVNKVTVVKIYDAHEFELEINGKNRIEEEIANAKLIASAPQLLEALQEIIIQNELRGYGDSSDMIKAKLAIEKALG